MTTSKFGLVSLQIGTGIPVTGTWSSIDWGGAVQFLGVSVDLTGGNTYTELSNSKLSSVPYAIEAAQSSDNKWKADETDIINKNTGSVGIGTKPAASAALDIKASGKGILIPRMTKAELPLTPAEGLLIYQTDNTPGFYYYRGGQWRDLDENGGAGSAGTVIPFASGPTPPTLSASLGGIFATAAAVGFGASVPASIVSGSIDMTRAGNVAFIVPKTGRITSVSGFFSSTDALSLTGTSVKIIGQLYRANIGTNHFFPIDGASVELDLGEAENIVLGTTGWGTTDGLSINVNAGTRLMMVYRVTTSSVDDEINLTGNISGGVQIQ